jgi:uncharacterized protein (DUF1330 family)
MKLLLGLALGAAPAGLVEAETKPATYVISEIEVTELSAVSSYVPRLSATITHAGGRILAATQRVVAFEGVAPKSYVVVSAFPYRDAAQAWRESTAYRELRTAKDKLANVRTFGVEGLPDGLMAFSAGSGAAAYVISEIDVFEPGLYARAYRPRALAALEDSGGRALADGGGKIIFDGEPPASHIVLSLFDGIDQAVAWRETLAFKRAKTLLDKSATVRSFAVEGLAE